MHNTYQICLLGFLGLITFIRGNVIVYTQDLPHKITEEFLDVPASFGPELTLEGLRGFLVTGEPEDGCTILKKPPVDPENFTGKWVVLLARYNCSFEKKIRNAQAAGFDCAIVHNVNSSELETMYANNSDGITIPSVFVSDISGIILSEEYVYTNGYYIMVNGDVPFNINTHLLLPFAVVVVLCLVVILIFMIVKCIKDRRRARRHRLPNRALRKIPTCKFSKGDPYDTCAICLDDYQEGERLRVLPCAHAYHAACVDPWLTQNRRVCPVCKRRVLAAGERAPSDLDSDTEPLVGAPRSPRTAGGTFEEQRVNPFVRAVRLIERARARRHATPDPEVAEPSEENDQEENESVQDTAPLVRGAGGGGGGGRRARRSRSAPRVRRQPRAARAARADASINATDAEGEIGVAALPAPAQSAPHVDL
ncbi:unnamed protein product, partial [Brenthis ino]